MEGRILDGRYQLLRLIGRGGMGVVYEGIQLELARRVAIKLLLDLGSNDDEERAVARFRQEALLVASLTHPNVVQVTDMLTNLDDGGPSIIPAAIVMEILDGESLATILRRDKKLDRARAISITHQILAGLSAAHARGIVHRDIKPGNVFVVRSSPEIVKILDFGIAKSLDAGGYRTTTGVVLGTPAYMAPEQVLAKPVDARTDLFAVGACLFEMLTGTRITGRATGPVVARAILDLDPSRLIAGFQSEIDAPLARVLERALAKDPTNRWPDATSMSSALVASLPKPAASASASKPKPNDARKLAMIAGGAIACSGAVGLVLATRNPPDLRVVAINSPSTEPPPPTADLTDEAGFESTTTEQDAEADSAAAAATSAHVSKCNCVTSDDARLDTHGLREGMCFCTKHTGEKLCPPSSVLDGYRCKDPALPRAMLTGRAGDSCKGKEVLSYVVYDEIGIIRCKGDLSPQPAKHHEACNGFRVGDDGLQATIRQSGMWKCEPR